MKHYIIYIPGLGDRYDGLRRFLLMFWRIYGVKTELVPMQWYAGGDFSDRSSKIQAAITAAQQKGYTVSLIGESAGGSAALNVMAENASLYLTISLAGVNDPNTPISSHIFRKSLAFKESVGLLQSSRDTVLKSRTSDIVSITGKSDPTVPVTKNLLPGAYHKKVWVYGHVQTILSVLSFMSFVPINIIKQHKKSDKILAVDE